MKLTLLRHGETEGSRRDLYYGAADIPVLPEALEALRHKALTGIYPTAGHYCVSGLQRTIQTLHAIYGDVDYTVLPGLREMDFGDFEMRAYAGDLEHDPQFIAWCEDVEHNICPHGESAAQVLARSVAAIEPVLRRGEDTVCVIHGGVTSGLMIHWFGGILYDYSPAPGTGYQVVFDDEKPLNYTKIG